MRLLLKELQWNRSYRGLIVSTILTLVVVPVAYGYIDDFRIVGEILKAHLLDMIFRKRHRDTACEGLTKISETVTWDKLGVGLSIVCISLHFYSRVDGFTNNGSILFGSPLFHIVLALLILPVGTYWQISTSSKWKGFAWHPWPAFGDVDLFSSSAPTQFG